MAEWTSLSVKESTRDRFNDAKDDMDDAQPSVPDLSADQFINTLLDTLEAAQDGYYNESNSNDIDVMELADAVAQNMNDRHEFRDIKNRLDELPEETARKTSERLQR